MCTHAGTYARTHARTHLVDHDGTSDATAAGDAFPFRQCAVCAYTRVHVRFRATAKIGFQGYTLHPNPNPNPDPNPNSPQSQLGGFSL